MSAYPPETLQALDSKATMLDHAASMHAMHVELFTEAVAAGTDVQLLWPCARGERKTYPVSEYLSDPPSEARAALFRACTAAMSGRDAGQALREFVGMVAIQYADDTVEMWGTE